MPFVSAWQESGKLTLDNKAGTLYEPGNACAHNSSLDVHFAPFNGFRVVVTALLLESAKGISQQAKQELHELGFPGWQGDLLDEVAMVGARHAKRSVKQWAAFHERNEVPEGDQIPLGTVDRTCIEFCSGKQSRMGR